MWARDPSDSRAGTWWAGRESNPHSRRRLIYSQRSSPPAQPTHESVPDRAAATRWIGRRALFALEPTTDSNPEPAVYKTAALPIELRRRAQNHTAGGPVAPGDDRARRPNGSSAGSVPGSAQLRHPQASYLVPCASCPAHAPRNRVRAAQIGLAAGASNRPAASAHLSIPCSTESGSIGRIMHPVHGIDARNASSLVICAA